MQRKFSGIEFVGFLIATAILLAAVKVTVGVFDSPALVFICLFLWIETLLMFVGLIEREPAYIILVKWFFVLKCGLCLFYLCALLILSMVLEKGRVDSSNNFAMIMGSGLTIFIVWVTHRLERFYSNLQKNRSGVVVVVAKAVCEKPAVSDNPTTEMAQTKEFPS